MHLRLYKVADTPFHIQGDDMQAVLILRQLIRHRRNIFQMRTILNRRLVMLTAVTAYLESKQLLLFISTRASIALTSGPRVVFVEMLGANLCGVIRMFGDKPQ